MISKSTPFEKKMLYYSKLKCYVVPVGSILAFSAQKSDLFGQAKAARFSPATFVE